MNCKRCKPKTSTNSLPSCFQSFFGNAIWCALKFPVAPPNFAAKGIWLNSLIWLFNRSTKTIISFPSFVGVAGWPCVCANMGISFHCSANDCNLFWRLVTAGKYSCSIQSFQLKGIAVLLMSCDVKPKCIHSFSLAAFILSNSCFKKYSTAFTSWLVVSSICFICSASFKLKFSASASSCCFVSDDSIKNFLSPRKIKYATSTFTRYFINAYSEKYLSKCAACLR